MGLHVRIPDLISEVYPRRPLWDREDPGHKNKELVNQLWQEVAKKCNITSEHKGQNFIIHKMEYFLKVPTLSKNKSFGRKIFA